LIVDDHTVEAQAPDGDPPGSSRRLVIGWVATIVGVCLIAAAVLAIRLIHQPIEPTASTTSAGWVKTVAEWSRVLDLAPFTIWGLAVIAIACIFGALGARLRRHGRGRRNPERSVVVVETPAWLVISSALSPFVAILLFAAIQKLEWSSAAFVVPWLTLLAAVTIGLAVSDRRQGRLLLPHIGRWEMVVLCAAAVAVFAFYASICSSWRFSFIGDEYAFFNYARDIAANGLFSSSWLDGMGVYRDNPRTMSVYQAAWMVVLGPTNLAWRLSAAFLAVICLPPLYLILRNLVGRCGGPARSAAVLGCVVFFSSEQIIVWAIEGKIHIAALPSVVFGLCLFLGARARGSALLYWLSGLACGAAFHLSLLGVAVSVPAVGLLIGLDILSQISRQRRFSLRFLVPGIIFVAAVLVLAAPYLVQFDLLRYAADTKMVHYEGADSVVARVKGAAISLLQPLSFSARDHFLWGNVVNVITAFLVCMAFFPGARRCTTGRIQTLLVLATCALMTGGLAQYTYPSVTRTFLIMVPVAMLTSLGFTALGPRRVTAAVLCLVLGMTVAVFNWVKIWHFNPYERLQDWHTLAMHEIEGTSPQHSIALIFSREDPRSYLLEKMVTIYGYGDRTIFLLFDRNLIEPIGLADLDHHLENFEVEQVLLRTNRAESEALVDMYADHRVPFRFIERQPVTPPPRGRFLETLLAATRRLERRHPERPPADQLRINNRPRP
jgi:4-amino-4-deoxy-L-arabinose transferase-like glycosyltransferase